MLVEVKENFEVKNLTSFKIGGKVDKLYFPSTQQEFVYLLKTLYEPLVVGSWSNLLVSSEGIKGNVICTSKLSKFEIKGTKVITDAGVKGPLLAQKTLDSGLSGFEFMIGFPGSIGGNIFMNAGAHAQTISDRLTSICVYDKEKKEVLVLGKDVLQFSYRTSILQKKPYVLLSAAFDLIKKPENDSAGRLLDKAGVKEFSVGGAKVWEGHANFIVNDGNATSDDVLELMYKMYSTVKDKYTINLHPEIRFVGEMTKREEGLCNIMYSQK